MGVGVGGMHSWKGSSESNNDLVHMNFFDSRYMNVLCFMGNK